MDLIQLQGLTHLANVYADAAVDLGIDIYHDRMAGCEPLDQTELRADRFQALSEALEDLVTRELAGRTVCRYCREVEVPAWSVCCRVCEAWGDHDEYLDRRDDLAQQAQTEWLHGATGQGDA